MVSKYGSKSKSCVATTNVSACLLISFITLVVLSSSSAVVGSSNSQMLDDFKNKRAKDKR